ncbi:MAG: MFS transporter [Candidatus Bathyarchaeia archaeon]
MTQPETSYRWVMLSLGWLSYFSFGLIYTATAPLVTPIMSELNLTYAQMGAITGAWQLVYIFSAQPLGFLVDWLGVYRSILIGTVVMAVSSILKSFAISFEDLFASVAIFGVGGPLISIGTPKLVSTWFRGQERGLSSGINASGSSVGSMAALGLTSSVVLPLAGNWRNVFLIYGVFGFIVAFIWLMFGGRKPQASNRGIELADSRPVESHVQKVFRNRSLWLIVIIGIIFFMITHGLQNWMPKILELKGFSMVVSGYATSLLTLAGILGSLLLPRLMYRSKIRKRLIVYLLSVSGFSIITIGLGQGLLLLLGIFSAGFFTRAIMPILTVKLMELPEVGIEHIGTVGGLFFSIGEIGGFLGPFLIGYLRDVTGSFVAGIASLAIATWIAIIAASLLKL